MEPAAASPRTALGAPAGGHATLDGLGTRAKAEGDGWWVEQSIPADAWTPAGLPGVYSTPIALGAPFGVAGASTGVRLSLPGEVTPLQDLTSEPDPLAADLAGAGAFAALGDLIYLRLPGLTPPSGEASLEVFYGVGALGDELVNLGTVSGRGSLVVPGNPVRCRVDAASRGTLTFTLATRCAYGGEPFQLTLEVATAAGVERAELRIEPGAQLTAVRIEDVAPAAANGAGTFDLSIQADRPLLAAALDPGFEPRDGAPTPLPDVVLFIADTFRADNLALHGGDPAWAPNLNALAERALVFEHAWSPSTWTLPSHATFFSGVHPHQHGATNSQSGLANDAVTLAERYQARGYRTVAITDSVYVSASYGLAQGFDLFDERAGDIGATLERIQRLRSDADSRPLFLFVQSYETHAPYAASSDELTGSRWEALQAEVLANAWDWRPDEAVPPGLQALLDRYEALYREGVGTFDRGFGAIYAALGGASFLAENYLIFTSDHGEAFGEHDEYVHGKSLWEEIIHVPLLLFGPGLEPGRHSLPVSTSRLAVTLAELSGLDAPAAWSRPSLLETDVRESRFAWGCYDHRDDMEVAVGRDDAKLIFAFDRGQRELKDASVAYDLGADPAEREPSPPDADAKPAGRAAERLLTPILLPTSARVSPEDRRRMAAMGYAGD